MDKFKKPEGFQPPLTNRGVVNTQNDEKTSINTDSNDVSFSDSMGGKYDLVIDWFECTFLGVSLVELVDRFKLDLVNDFVFVNRGLFGYNKTYVYKEKIKFMFSADSVADRNHRQGIHLLMSGYACREFEKEFTWKWLIDLCVEMGVNMSRIDIAWDLFTDEFFTIKRIQWYLCRGLVSCKAKKALDIQERSVSDGERLGHSIKFGSSTSDVSCIFYDKLQERKSADYIVSEDIKHWYRLELRIRHESADKFIENLFLHPGQESSICLKVLNNYISFKEKSDSDVNKSRWQNVKWWSDFIEVTDRIKLSNKAIQSTIQQKIDFVYSNWSKTLSMVFLSSETDDLPEGEELEKKIRMGIRKLSALDLSAINAYRIENGGSVISKEKFEELQRRLSVDIRLLREYQE